MKIIAKSQPLHTQVYEYIKEKIISGEIPCGEKVQEVKLSTEINISRSPVREALRTLENDGLIVQSENGLIVNPMTYDDTVEVYECRILFESFAARLAATNISNIQLEELAACVHRMHELHDKDYEGSYLNIISNNTRFHQIIAEASNHRLITGYINKNNALSMLARANEFNLFHRDSSYITEHISIYNAINNHNPSQAEKAVKNHISNDLRFFKEKYSIQMKKNSNI